MRFYAEANSNSHSHSACELGELTALQNRCGVTTNQKHQMNHNAQKNIWSILLAAAAALICVAIDHVTKEEEQP